MKSFQNPSSPQSPFVREIWRESCCKQSKKYPKQHSQHLFPTSWCRDSMEYYENGYTNKENLSWLLKCLSSISKPYIVWLISLYLCQKREKQQQQSKPNTSRDPEGDTFSNDREGGRRFSLQTSPASDTMATIPLSPKRKCRREAKVSCVVCLHNPPLWEREWVAT